MITQPTHFFDMHSNQLEKDCPVCFEINGSTHLTLKTIETMFIIHREADQLAREVFNVICKAKYENRSQAHLEFNPIIVRPVLDLLMWRFRKMGLEVFVRLEEDTVTVHLVELSWYNFMLGNASLSELL